MRKSERYTEKINSKYPSLDKSDYINMRISLILTYKSNMPVIISHDNTGNDEKVYE
jgi:hypothetical protein